MSRNLQEMHQSVGKITDENVLLFSSQTKFALQKAAIVKLVMWYEKGLHTSIPISHFETLLLFIYFYFLHYEQNCDFSNILKYFRCRAVFLISVSAESLLNAWSVERKLLVLHSAHILWSDTATQMWLFVNDYRRILHRVTAHYHAVTKYTVTVSHGQF